VCSIYLTRPFSIKVQALLDQHASYYLPLGTAAGKIHEGRPNTNNSTKYDQDKTKMKGLLSESMLSIMFVFVCTLEKIG